ncbi:MAG TPA: 3,4-dihydroxyphenylacetate 2,3-dioxygenase [Acetobacteraceae bacterium]|jgi:catechol 2,3-dioxygenase|nr:3,4-dihydroxyphenylacetate 2,3-dioxygenase [Acetobacteraceae bacterium]
MPIAPPVDAPPFRIVRTSHVELGVTDLGRARAFWCDALGLAETASDADALHLRGMEERAHHSLVLRRAAAPCCRAIGLRVWSEDDLDRAAHWFGARELPTGFVARQGQGRTLATVDPAGTPLEFYAASDAAECLLQQYGRHRGARPQRIDHVNCFTPDCDASFAFYNALGFRLTEYTVAEDGEALWAVWMQRKGGVHDIAFTNGAGPRLHHLAYWAGSVNAIVDACDILATTGWLAAMERGPGRHGISNAFFLYARDPDGHRVELFASDYLTVDADHAPKRWELRDAQRQTLWGAAAPRSWFEEGTGFEGVATLPPVRESRPIVAP